MRADAQFPSLEKIIFLKGNHCKRDKLSMFFRKIEQVIQGRKGLEQGGSGGEALPARMPEGLAVRHKVAHYAPRTP